jgi:dTDP-4-dehydrorhamnose reductase
MAHHSPILVLGASGLLGRHLRVRGLTGLDRSACDVTSARDRERALREHRPRAVIYCAAQANVDACEDDRGAWAVNAEAPAAWARQVELWYVSTNYVFSGPGPHLPGGPTAPLQAYGRQKLAGEDAVQAAGGHVVRTGWLFGAGGGNFLSRLPQLLRAGPLWAFADSSIQPTWAGDLAALLLALPQGLTHAVGREETTFAGAARSLAATMGLHPVIHEHPGPAGALPAPRPKDARLTPASLPGWTERLERLVSGRLVHPGDHQPG